MSARTWGKVFVLVVVDAAVGYYWNGSTRRKNRRETCYYYGCGTLHPSSSVRPFFLDTIIMAAVVAAVS